jgi:hypothetical protein
LLLENSAFEFLHSASLMHSRSPFGCASSASTIGSVSHPAGDRPSHPICETGLSVIDSVGLPVADMTTYQELAAVQPGPRAQKCAIAAGCMWDLPSFDTLTSSIEIGYSVCYIEILLARFWSRTWTASTKYLELYWMAR